jgi:8-oxo-dGTP diphosphatase
MKNISVCAAVIASGDTVLVTTRPPGQEMSGRWEFPGGKIEPGESPADCLTREIKEELDLDILVFDTMFITDYEYPGKKVNIRFMRCRARPGTMDPVPQEGQQWAWVKLDSLPEIDLLPADKPFADFLANIKNSKQ